MREGTVSRRQSSSSSAAGGTAHGSNVTSSSHVAKKSKTDHSKDGTASSSPAKTRQTQNAGPDHPTPGTLTKAQTEFNTKVGMKDPLPDILAEMGLPPVVSRIVHRRSNRITEINTREESAKAGNTASPMSTRKKVPINRAVEEHDLDQDRPTQPQNKSGEDDEEEEEAELEGTDDDAATEDQDDDDSWNPRTQRAVKLERLDCDISHTSSIVFY